MSAYIKAITPSVPGDWYVVLTYTGGGERSFLLTASPTEGYRVETSYHDLVGTWPSQAEAIAAILKRENEVG